MEEREVIKNLPSNWNEEQVGSNPNVKESTGDDVHDGLRIFPDHLDHSDGGGGAILIRYNPQQGVPVKVAPWEVRIQHRGNILESNDRHGYKQVGPAKWPSLTEVDAKRLIKQLISLIDKTDDIRNPSYRSLNI